jgi:hypothetical protein
MLIKICVPHTGMFFWLVMMVCFKRKVLLSGGWRLICSERELLAGVWFVLREK